jgi:hypothetical protein
LKPGRAVAAATLVAIPSCAGVLGLDEVAEIDDPRIDARAPDAERPREDAATIARDGDVGTDAADGAVPCTGASCERYVFVTSAPTTGALDGVVGADARCQQFADASSIAAVRGRRFAAWISTTNNPVGDRLVHGTAPYKRVDGVVVATSWATFASASHLATMNLDESGRNVGDSNVWTATMPDGTTAVTGDCDLWSTGTTSQGAVGLTLATDGRWTKTTFAIGCEQRAHLYCVER